MKKISFILSALFLAIGCSQKGPDKPALPDIQCTINGYDCWLIIQDIKDTEIIYPQGKENWNVRSYQNPALNARGLSITHYDMFKDGGSKIYTLSNGVNIFKNFRAGSSEQGYTTVSWPDKKSITFDNAGHAIRQTAAADCVVGPFLCEDFAREINRFFRNRDNVPPAPGYPIEPDGSYIGQICVDGNCSYSRYHSELNLLRLSADKRHQEGNIYTYDLPEGKKLIFNWNTESPEYGILTVIEKDGTQKKFDSHGKLIKK